MPRTLPPNLHREVTRFGHVLWYVRRGHGPRTRLLAPFGSDEFYAEYRAAIGGKAVVRGRQAPHGTLEWLWQQYRTTTAWSGLASSTRRQRENIMRHVMTQSGHAPANAIRRQHIVAGRDRRTAAAAKHFLTAIKGLFAWAVDAGHVKDNPAADVKPPQQRKSGGFPTWSEEDVVRYEARWPVGTRQRVWMAVLLYTGLRRSDAVLLGRQHVKDGVATLKNKKTKVTVVLPILPVLDDVLRAGPTGDLAYICGARGNPLTAENFGNEFRDACRAAGVGARAHGLRKLGAVRAAEAGATVAELEAIFGWSGGRMAALYTEAANRARLSKGAMGKLEGSGAVEQVRTYLPEPERGSGN